MFGKNREIDLEPSFQKDAEYSLLPEDSMRDIEEEKEEESGHEKMPISAIVLADAKVEGAIKFDGAMRIDGNVNGEISTDNGELVVSESGIVNANITTRNAVIEGRVDGKIIASDKVALKQKAHLIGDLQAKTLVIEEGVVFVGRCNVNPEGVKSDNIARKDKPKTDHNQQKNFNINKKNTARTNR